MDKKITTISEVMLQLIIQDDYCATTETEIVNHCLSRHTLKVTGEECIAAANHINSTKTNAPNIISTGYVEMPMMFVENGGERQPVFRSDYSNSSLLKVLTDINTKSD